MFDFDGYAPTEPRGYDALGEGPLQRYYRGRRPAGSSSPPAPPTSPPWPR